MSTNCAGRHQCDMDDRPMSIGDRSTCAECGREWEAVDIWTVGVRISERVKPYLDRPQHFGWRGLPTADGAA